MTNWINIEDQLPDPNQPITATIKYQNQISEVHGVRSSHEEQVVIFDFYSGSAAETIIQWKPRIPPNNPNAHPWTGIENRG